MEYPLVKWMHILSSTLLFGTGIGTAFFLLATTLTRNIRAVAAVTRLTVVADCIFTTPTAVFQPASGFWLLHLMGSPLSAPWVRWSIILYAIALACWLPVVWIQIRLRDIAAVAVQHPGTDLPPLYWRYFKLWVLLGIPAFLSFLAIFYLMVVKPA